MFQERLRNLAKVVSALNLKRWNYPFNLYKESFESAYLVAALLREVHLLPFTCLGMNCEAGVLRESFEWPIIRFLVC